MQQKMLITGTLLLATSIHLLGSEHPSKVKEYFGRPTTEQYAFSGFCGSTIGSLSYTSYRGPTIHHLKCLFAEKIRRKNFPDCIGCRMVPYAVRGSILSVAGASGAGLGLGLLLAPFWVKKFAELKNNE